MVPGSALAAVAEGLEGGGFKCASSRAAGEALKSKQRLNRGLREAEERLTRNRGCWQMPSSGSRAQAQAAESEAEVAEEEEASIRSLCVLNVFFEKKLKHLPDVKVF